VTQGILAGRLPDGSVHVKCYGCGEQQYFSPKKCLTDEDIEKSLKAWRCKCYPPPDPEKRWQQVAAQLREQDKGPTKYAS